jgi:hypothetical protein
MKTTTADHALTLEEIGRQIRLHSARRVEIVNERAEIYSNYKTGGRPETTVADADERAAREHARTLLNGQAPASLSMPPELDRDRILLREQRGIDIAIRVLSNNQVAARAAAAVTWAERHADEWRTLARDVVLASIRSDALNRRAVKFLERCPDPFAVHMPLVGKLDGREVALNKLIEAALAEGVITSGDIRKAENG